MSLRHWILVFLLAAIALQANYYYPLLPGTVASHFGYGGRANGWSSKEVFYWTYFGIVLLMVFIFFLIPIPFRRFPASSMNLPHKEYWLAPERREETLSYLTRQMNWMGNLALAFILGTLQLVMKANVAGQGGFSEHSMWMLLAGFLILLGFWLIRLYRRFGNPS